MVGSPGLGADGGCGGGKCLRGWLLPLTGFWMNSSEKVNVRVRGQTVTPPASLFLHGRSPEISDNVTLRW